MPTSRHGPISAAGDTQHGPGVDKRATGGSSTTSTTPPVEHKLSRFVPPGSIIMQGDTSNSSSSNKSKDGSFPPIEGISFKLDTTIYDISVQYNNFELTMMKNVAGGMYKGERVIMMQISGTASRIAKQKAFRDNLRFCITSSNFDEKNIARFIGGTDPSQLHPAPFVLFHDSEGVDHEEFLRLNKSPRALFKFLDGAQEGSRFIYSNDIKHRDCIKVSPLGDAVVYPSGLLLSKFSGRNSTKRAVRHFLRDVGGSNPTLPLQAVYELLSAATTTSQAKAIERTLIDAEPDSLNDLVLWRIADSLQLPLTRELHYYGPKPDFTLSIGDLGLIKPPPLGRNLSEANALIRFQGWRPLKVALRSETKWQRHLCTRAMKLQVITPYFSDGLFQPSEDASEGWVRYDDVLRGIQGDQIDMCLLYATERGSRPRAESSSWALEDNEALFTIRSICVRVRFDIPDMKLLPGRLYFHRTTNPDASPREYWGFISDEENPLVTPSYKVQDILLRYEMHIQTSMEGDSWSSRAEAYTEEQIRQLPGTYIPY